MSQPRSIVRRRALAAASALAALAFVTSACSSSQHSGSQHSSTTPSPRMISNGGHRLAFYVTPGRLPAIVLDSGGGSDASYWKNLVPVLARDTGSEVIAYDRAGMGASDEVPGPWTVQDATADLGAGLTALGLTHDVVLVSHSEAGEIATCFANQHPGWIAGAVLVDASLPDFYTDSEISRIVAVNQQQIAALASQPSTKQTRQLQAVAQNYAPWHTTYHQMSWPRNIPATVIASAKTPFDASPSDAQLWREAQTSFAAEAPNRRLITAAGTSHDVPLDRPDIVIQAVDALAAAVGPGH
jgi:pimeloyl-ACP methyl ester carboxylesterase